MRCCGRGRRKDGQFVALRYNQETNSAGYAGVNHCGSVWACPVCSAKIAATRQTEISKAVNVWSERDNGQVAMFTFTMRHNASQRLDDLWDGLGQGWREITKKGSAHRGEIDRLGVNTVRRVHTGQRKGQDVPHRFIPWLRVIEATHGKNGWHLHVHALVFLQSDVSHDEMQDLYGRWHERWSRGLSKAGIHGSEMVNKAVFLSGKQVDQKIGDYLTKTTYNAGDVAGLEVARSDLKSARFGNRTPFEILRGLALADADIVQDGDEARWREWEIASKGKRQLTWAGETRNFLGLGEELTDEEIADQEIGTEEDTVLWITPTGWKRLLERSARRIDLLDLTEQEHGRLSAILPRLDRWRIEYTLTLVESEASG